MHVFFKMFIYFNLFFFENAHALVVKLDMKFIHQNFSLSCEPASLSMVLNYHGIKISENDVIKIMPFDQTPKSKLIWGDPNIGFVGDINGKSFETGYGIHWTPMASLASKWLKTTILTHSRLNSLTYYILKKEPVIIWVYDGSGEKIFWNTVNGKKISAIKDEHTVIVYGFDGNPKNPLGFFIMDPAHGPTYWSKQKLLERWRSFKFSGIVLHRKKTNE